MGHNLGDSKGYDVYVFYGDMVMWQTVDGKEINW